jgi:ABC-2 type transport system ATP-binding protein
MWETVERLKADGVTIILTTHYLEEAEALADRVGVINRGELLLVEETGALMDRMGRKELVIELHEPVAAIPAALAGYDLDLAQDGTALVYCYDRRAERTGITRLLADLQAAGLALRDLSTRQSSLEEIFVGLVQEDAA